MAHGKVRPLDPDEPARVAEAVKALGLQHVVVTSVDRDDLSDGGAAHFAATARAIKALAPGARVEVLVPDFRGSHSSVETVVEAPVDVFNHNVETVPRLYKKARPGGDYARSLDVLGHARQTGISRGLLTKTGIMLGLGEEIGELTAVLSDLRDVKCDILTLGQYLRPSRDHLPVERYVRPERVRGTARAGARDGLPARRVRPAGQKLVPRLGARQVSVVRGLRFRKERVGVDGLLRGGAALRIAVLHRPINVDRETVYVLEQIEVQRPVVDGVNQILRPRSWDT